MIDFARRTRSYSFGLWEQGKRRQRLRQQLRQQQQRNFRLDVDNTRKIRRFSVHVVVVALCMTFYYCCCIPIPTTSSSSSRMINAVSSFQIIPSITNSIGTTLATKQSVPSSVVITTTTRILLTERNRIQYNNRYRRRTKILIHNNNNNIITTGRISPLRLTNNDDNNNNSDEEEIINDDNTNNTRNDVIANSEDANNYDTNDNNNDDNNNSNIINNYNDDGDYIIPRGVTVKIALDSRGGVYEMNRTATSTGADERFTCSESLDLVHRLRCVSDAVVIGKGTVITDNPSLTIRRVPCTRRCCRQQQQGQSKQSSSSSSRSSYQPLRVIIDSKLSVVQWKDPSKLKQQNYTILTDGLPTIVYYSSSLVTISISTIEQLKSFYPNLDLVGLPSTITNHDTTEILSIPDIIHHLQSNYNVRHIMVEGGPSTVTKFIQAGCIDRCIIIKAPSVTFQQPLVSGITPSYLKNVGQFHYLGLRFCGHDTIHYWSKPNLPWPTVTNQLQNWP